MNTIAERREIPVGGEVDVLVAGGGTAGVPAAIAAARHGARVMLIEQFGFLGGTQTAGLVAPICPNYDAAGRPLTQGIGQEIWNRLAERGGTVRTEGGLYPNPGGDWPWFDPESLKYLLDDMVTEAGVEVLFHTWISDVLREGNTVTGLIIENKSGRQAIGAKMIVDATGDADVAARAGVEYESGRPTDGKNQAVSLRFHVGGVDLGRLAEFLREQGMPRREHPTISYAFGAGEKDAGGLIEQALRNGEVEPEVVRYFQFYTIPGRPGELTFNCPELHTNNPVDARELSRLQIEGRRRIRKTFAFCRRCLAGFENAYIAATAPLIGIRSSRRILGEYVLTEADVLAGRKFPDAVARNNWPPDIHAPGKDENLVFKRERAHGDFVEIPYRCLVPRVVDGLLVAGRCISATFEAQAAIRISRTCQALGQAAGTAAALAVGAAEGRGIPARDLNGSALHTVLTRDGLFPAQ